MKSSRFFCVVFLGAVATQGRADDTVTIVDKPGVVATNNFYVGNRGPLIPSPLLKLPVGSVRPRGWLLRCLERQRDGLTGHLGSISAWLQKEDNAWLAEDGKGEWGWEELPYWLKGYGDIGYLLDDREMIGEARIWLEGALGSQRPNGDFGPGRRFEDGSRDFWANMIMLYCLRSYHEYSGDRRVLELMSRYFKFQLTVPDNEFLTHYWQRMRGGDNLDSVYWLYNRTGEKQLLELAEKIHRNTADWGKQHDLPNWHNVNVAQAFGEPATYYQQSQNVDDLRAAYDNFGLIRELYGQVPGGMFGADENARRGYDDPRQAIETCGVIEQMLSDETLLRITADSFWADHAEEVAFNTLPATFTADFKAFRYLTSPNMVLSDRHNHAPGVQNGGPMLMMNPLSHRCCQHNHSHGWPYFAESLWMATPDNGLCAAIYSASVVEAKVGSGHEIAVEEETRYPFEEQIRFKIKTARPVVFPLYLRIPVWCEKPRVRVNGKDVLPSAKVAGKFVRIDREWADGDVAILDLPMKVSVRIWKKNHNSASVDYGPLTFSLMIGEKYVAHESHKTALGGSQWQADLDASKWPAFEIHPTTPWNYGLILNPNDPEASFTVVRRPWPKTDFPYTVDDAPITLRAKGRRIPAWQLDRHGLVATLQDSPVNSNEPTESITLIPMGAARLRISAFPVIGRGPDANRWTGPPELLPYHPTASHCFHSDSVTAMNDQIEPASSGDHSIPRMTWWEHRGSREWVQYTFEKPKQISSVEVYWFDDTGRGHCRVPHTWQLSYRDGDQWAPVKTADKFRVAKDRYNRIAFEPITTSALRIEAQLQPESSAGILEWKLR